MYLSSYFEFKIIFKLWVWAYMTLRIILERGASFAILKMVVILKVTVQIGALFAWFFFYKI